MRRARPLMLFFAGYHGRGSHLLRGIRGGGDLGIVALVFLAAGIGVFVVPSGDILGVALMLGIVMHADELQAPAFRHQSLLEAVDAVDAEVFGLAERVGGRERVLLKDAT